MSSAVYRNPYILEETWKDHCRQIYANRVRRIAVSFDTEIVRTECGAGYLFVTAGAVWDWWFEGQGALVIWLRVRGERLGGQVNLPSSSLAVCLPEVHGHRVYTTPLLTILQH